VPWRQVTEITAYAGPRNGLRLRFDLECGHAFTRAMNAAQRARFETQPGEPVSTQCIGRCWVCSLLKYLGPEIAFDRYHAPNGVFSY
jgi:hypothetical protein